MCLGISPLTVQRRKELLAGRAGSAALHVNFDTEQLLRVRDVDWHGNDQRETGKAWNQWEAGIGTGGSKIRPYKTDEFLHGENLHTSDEEQDSEDEIPEEKMTLAQKKKAKEMNPGIFPTPEVSVLCITLAAFDVPVIMWCRPTATALRPCSHSRSWNRGAGLPSRAVCWALLPLAALAQV